MPTISQIVAQIRTAIFGKDVRENIALGIEQTYDEITGATAACTTLSNRLVEPFNPDNPYKIGQFVSYNSDMWQFIADHTAGDAWDAGEVINPVLGNEMYDVTEFIPGANITAGFNYTTNGVTLVLTEDQDVLKLYGTASATRRVLFLNGQKGVRSTSGAFAKTLDAGVYYVESDMTGAQTSYSVAVTYNTFNTFSHLVQSTNKNRIVEFTDPVMIGFTLQSGRNYGTEEEPTYLKIKILRKSAKDIYIREKLDSQVNSIEESIYGAVGNKAIKFIPDKFVTVTSSTINLETDVSASTSGCGYAVIDVNPGEFYTINSYGGSSRAWAVIDSEGNRLSMADSGAANNYLLRIPLNGSKLIINAKPSDGPSYYNERLTKIVSNTIEDVNRLKESALVNPVIYQSITNVENWVVGVGVTKDGGEHFTNEKYSRSGYIPLDKPTVFWINDPNYEFVIWEYSNNAINYAVYSPSKNKYSKDPVIITKNHGANYFKIGIHRTDDDVMTSDDITAIISAIKTYTPLNVDTINEMREIEKNSYDVEHEDLVPDVIKSDGLYALFVGSFNPDTGENTTSTTRCKTYYIRLDRPVMIKFDHPDYYIRVYGYTDISHKSGTLLYICTDRTGDNKDWYLITPKNGTKYIRVSFGRMDNAVLTTDDTDPTNDWYIIEHNLKIDEKIPINSYPKEDGTYTLRVNVSNGEATYDWARIDSISFDQYYFSGINYFSGQVFGIIKAQNIIIPANDYLEIPKQYEDSDRYTWYNSLSLKGNNITIDSSTYEAIIKRSLVDGHITVLLKSKTGSDIIITPKGTNAQLTVNLNGSGVEVTQITPKSFVVTGMSLLNIDFGIHLEGDNIDPVIIPADRYLELNINQSVREAKLQYYNAVSSVKINGTTLASSDYTTVIERNPANGVTTIKIKSNTGSDITVPVVNNKLDLEVIASGYQAKVAPLMA